MITKSLSPYRVDKDHLRRYKSMCGYDTNDSHVPICYPETLFFRQLSAILSSRKFCLSPIGLLLFKLGYLISPYIVGVSLSLQHSRSLRKIAHAINRYFSAVKKKK